MAKCEAQLRDSTWPREIGSTSLVCTILPFSPHIHSTYQALWHCTRDRGGVLHRQASIRVATVNAACLRSCLAIEGKEKGRNHANSGTGSIRVGSMGQRDHSVRRAEPHAGATATADAAR